MWGAIAAGAMQLGGSILSATSKKKNPGLEVKQLKDYPEVESARKSWWQKLQDWQEDPNYGAISPDWASMWELAQNKVKQFYSGTPTTPGYASKIKASLARRNMATSPASEMALARLGAEEGGQIKELALNEAVNKATFAEQGRQTWLQSLQNLNQMKPSYATSAGAAGGSNGNIGSVISALGDSLGGYAKQKQQNDFLKELLGGLGMGGSGGGGYSGLMGNSSADGGLADLFASGIYGG